MRLTKFHKETFVRGVIRDLPTYEEEIKTLAEQMQEVLKVAINRTFPQVLKDAIQQQPDAAVHIKTHDRWVSGVGYLYHLRGAEQKLSADVVEEIQRLSALQNEYRGKNNGLEAELRDAVMGITTLAKLKQVFPQFLKYMPQDTTPPKTANVPAVICKELTEKLAAAGLQLPEVPKPLPDFIVDEAPVPIPAEAAEEERPLFDGQIEEAIPPREVLTPLPIYNPTLVDGVVIPIPAPETETL